MANLHSAESVLKTIYLSAISEKLNNSNPFFSQIEKTSNDVWGKEIRKVIPTENKGHFQIVSNLKNLYAKIEITDKEIKASQISASNLTNLLNVKCEEMLSESNKWLNEMLFVGKGETDLTGFDIIFSESKQIYGLARDEHKKLIPLIKTDFGKISINKIDGVIDELDNDTNIIFCSFDVKRAYQQYLLDYKQNIDIVNIGNGFKAISHLGIPIVADRQCPKGTMYLLNTSDFKFHQLCDWRWLENENGRILRQRQDGTTYDATLVKYGDLICKNIAGQAKITGIKT